MGHRKSNHKKAKPHNVTVKKPQVTQPSISLRQLYEERYNLSAHETLNLLNKLTTTLRKTEDRLNPGDVETIWLILCVVCDKTITDHELTRMGALIEDNKLYQQFSQCCSFIMELQINNKGKKLKLELLLKALCKTTALYLTVATDAATTIRPNFFLDLYNTTQDPSVQVLEIHPEVVLRLEHIHLMLTGNNSQEDSGIDVSETESQTIAQPERSHLFTANPPDDIANRNVVPTHHDIFWLGKIFLRPNFVRRSYPDLETYKDVQFRLLMEDFMQPLRQGITKLVNGNYGPKGVQELRIYENATLKFLQNPHNVPERESSWRFYSVQFQALSRINWNTSRRLIHGTLVCLWDGTNELVIASVANSNPEDLARGKAVLVLESQQQPINFTKKAYVMLESVVFFEPYRAVLQVLQNFTYDNFPMLDYFLGYEKNPLPPSYVKKAPSFNLKLVDDKPLSIRDMVNFASWPVAEKLGLDKRQHVALMTALTSRLSLIQGPPGTGKTFLALRILRLLLDNKNLWQGKFSVEQDLILEQIKNTYGDSYYVKNKIFWKKQGARLLDDRTPVVVICFTNHALDQFLGGIMDSTNRIVRVGSQSKSARLDEYNLNQIKRQAMTDHNIGPYKESTYFHYFYRMKEVRARMEVLYNSIQAKIRYTQSFDVLKVVELKNRAIIHVDVYNAFLSAEKRQPQKRKNTNILKWWLGWSNHRQLLKVLRETRLNIYKNQVAKAAAAVEEEKLDEDQTEQIRDRDDDDIDEDIIDDEDYREELRLAKEQVDVVDACPENVDEDEDDFERRLQVAASHEDKSLIDFAKNQVQRMHMIRDLLLSMPPDTNVTESVSADEILTLPLSKRWMLFAHWKRTYQDMVNQDLLDTQKEYQSKIKEFNQLKGEALSALCRTADVVGMTTTGAAKNRSLLENLKAKIVIVEEAAEVLESHIVCSLTADCQQLIMIGDHQQLRPSVNVHELATKFQLDVSLFERLIVGDMKPVKLGVQHRMRPEVARLIVPAVYAHLENHSSVYSHPHIPGMQHDVFFYHHTNPEKEDGSSFYNLHEVAMALHLALYLVREHGVSPNRITILATYTAQLHQLLNARTKNFVLRKELFHTRMTVVDNFQGEENDIIILSLVRNNNRDSVGFLRIDNRVCVALSRARNGLYILGNIRMLAAASPLWAHMEQVLTEHGEIGEEFPLRCDQHHQTVLKVKKVEEFPTGSFCNANCGTLIKCGHDCQRTCHKQGPHTETCKALVVKRLACGHSQLVACSQGIIGVLCHQPVPFICKPLMHEVEVACSDLKRLRENVPCPFPVVKTLPCGHDQKLHCSDRPDRSLCQTLENYQLACSHNVEIPCSTPIAKRAMLHMHCQQPVRKTLPCGHIKAMKCCDNELVMECGRVEERTLDCGHSTYYECTGVNVRIVCMIWMKHLLPCGHTEESPCSHPPKRCNHLVDKTVKCGHTIKAECWNPSPICHVVVMKMLMCGHENPVSCSQGIESVICSVDVEVLHPICSHIQSVPCPTAKNELQLRLCKCTAVPLKMLNCGHEMRIPCCQEVNDTIVCTTMVNYVLPCDHEVIIACHTIEKRSKEKCKLDCLAPLDCEHFCSLPCHDRTEPHVCKRQVEKQLGCGHFMKMPCNRSVAKAICFTPVFLRRSCGHVWQTTCGEVLSARENVCREMKTKQLPCGHSVTVKCSEPIDKIVCQEPYEQVLGCRHSVLTNCGVPLGKRLSLPCNVDETRNLPCGHIYPLKCGSKDAEKPLEKLCCRVLVKKKVPNCEHIVEIECGKAVSRKDCTSMCKKILDCGHRCPLQCKEKCTVKACQYEVELEGVSLPCGHPFRTECHLRYASRDVIEAKIKEMAICNSRCPAELACGHKCTSTCNQCLTNEFHSVCTQPCKRTLICGHKCEAQCGKVCPPCKKPCGYQCSHQKCTLVCGEECDSCMKACEWKCPHVQCKHPCYEFCNRDPCNKPCSNVLSCGHHCNGLCGEICPPQCHICSRICIPKYQKKIRYIYLECGHWNEVEKIDKELNLNANYEEPVRKIECPSCPQCGIPIRQSFRYGDLIKAFYVDLVSIKWDFFNKDSVSGGKIRKALNKLLQMKTTHSAAIKSITQQVESVESLGRNQHWDLLYRIQMAYFLCCLENDTKIKYVVVLDKQRNKKELCLDEGSVKHLLKKVSMGFRFMEKHADTGQAYYIDLFNAVTRFDLHRQYFVIKAISDQIFPSLCIDQRQLDTAAQMLDGSKLWTDDDENYMVNWLKRKSEFYNGINLSGSVKKTNEKFIERMNMSSAGTWYKCTKSACETVFSSSRYNKCPECLDEPESC